MKRASDFANRALLACTLRSHVLLLDRGQYFRAMKAFFGDIGFTP